MGTVTPRAAVGFRFERDDAPEPVFDRLLGQLTFRWHQAFARRRQDTAVLAAAVALQAAPPDGAGLPAQLAALRYRLRRDGFTAAHVAACFALQGAAAAARGLPGPGEAALAAAEIQLRGGLAEVADPAVRDEALRLAAVAWAIYGVPVHVLTASEARARSVAAGLQGPLAALGFAVGLVTQDLDTAARRTAYAAAVVCGGLREVAFDYLRDRAGRGVRQRPLGERLERLTAGGGERAPVLRGLQCALVDEADAAMLDDAHLPLVLVGESDRPRERLLYEQALELARALAAEADYTLQDDGPHLTPAGAARLERVVGSLGGIWAAPQRREDLIVLALHALHQLEREVHYQVAGERVVLPPAEGASAAEPAADADQTLQRLLEVKEGCRLGAPPDILARLSVPRFLRRYGHLAGTCADARGVEAEFWSMYGLATTGIGVPAPRIGVLPRVFLSTAAKRLAVVQRVRELGAAGYAVVVALRTQSEAQAVIQALGAAGLAHAIVQGSGQEAERQAVAGLAAAAAVVLLLHPAQRSLARVAGAVPLAVVVPELFRARRELDGLCRSCAAARCELLVALEDEAAAGQLGRLAAAWARRGADDGGELPAARAQRVAAYLERSLAQASRLMREDVIQRDRQLDDLLAFSGRAE